MLLECLGHGDGLCVAVPYAAFPEALVSSTTSAFPSSSFVGWDGFSGSAGAGSAGAGSAGVGSEVAGVSASAAG